MNQDEILAIVARNAEIKNPTRGMKVATRLIAGRDAPCLPECVLPLHRENCNGKITAFVAGFDGNACFVRNEETNFIGAYWLDELKPL